MELLLAIVVVVVFGALIYFNRSSKGLDINADGKVDVTDANAAVQNTVSGIKSAADVNKDGIVDTKDAEAVVEVVKTEVKKVASRGRKPKPLQ